MREWQSLSHVKWECKYHIVIVPKYRRKVLYGHVRRRLGEILRQLCRQKGVELVEGNTTSDHVHMILSVPPKFSIAMVIGYLKGKSAIQIHREFQGSKRGFTGKHFWSRGYCVSTVGLDEKKIREYVQHQNKHPTPEGPVLDTPRRGYFTLPPKGARMSSSPATI